MTKLQLLVNEWKDCKRCPLAEYRDNVVMVRGTIPCSILFIGEAPGRSENVLGVPFVGPAGQLLDSIVADSVPTYMAYALTNLISCIPLDDENRKTTEPDDECVKACSPRLQQLVKLADPKLIVCVGKLPATWLDPTLKDSIKFHKRIPQVTITHPAAILIGPVVQQGLAMRKAAITIRDAIQTYLIGASHESAIR